jgi:hypothetical protein
MVLVILQFSVVLVILQFSVMLVILQNRQYGIDKQLNGIVVVVGVSVVVVGISVQLFLLSKLILSEYPGLH